jgi:hypothetical protein
MQKISPSKRTVSHGTFVIERELPYPPSRR